MLKLILAAIALGLAGPAFAGDSHSSGVRNGIAAYKSGDFHQAKELLTPIAMAGDLRAKRYVAYILLDHDAKGDFDPGRAVGLLSDAAKQGDYAALIKLEELRQEGLAFSPSLDDIIEVETHRASKGDPVLAWRLAKRYEYGDGVVPSNEEAMRWLKVAAAAPISEFPKSGEAAYRLCVMHASTGVAADMRSARAWCGEAADRGEAAAAVMLGRLAP